MSKNSKTRKTAQKQTAKKQTQKMTSRMGIPTIGQRLDKAEALLLGAVGILELGDSDLSSINPHVDARKLNAGKATQLCQLLGRLRDELYELQQQPADILEESAPTDDQRREFETLYDDPAEADSQIGGAR